jgi:hypothetical protein
VNALWIALGAFLSLYVLWVYFLAVMALERVDDITPLTGAVRAFALCVLLPGYLLDAVVNLTVMTVLLLDVPREWLVTARLSRLISDDGWRGRIARWFCSTLLDPFDPRGCHCKRRE